ncbi:MAG: colanic acid biosynthesis glycosyltransferase WcaL [Beggiatoa sp. IS2]|nr:MAG: colanic acid biosynthesis glycosyltransferase WcaL [Beggiatoa sp. IS2]
MIHNKVRLAYLVSRYPAVSHTFILREVRTLRQLGFDIQVASINAPDRPTAELTADERTEEANTYYVKPAGILGALTAHGHTLLTQPVKYVRGLAYALKLGKFDLKKMIYGLFYFVEAVMIGQWLRRQQCTHLHVHFATQAATVGLIARQMFPITFSMTVHGPDEFYDVSHFYLAEKVRVADFIYCISHFARSQLSLLSTPDLWDKLKVSRLGVDTTVFSPRPFREQPDPFEVLCVGRLVPAKGQFLLIEAIANLVANGRSVRLRLVGDGPDRPRLESAVKQRNLMKQVIFTGAVNQDRIRDFYRQADAFALASFAEGLPVVLMEAMAMEIPCVTTHIAGIPELIKTGEGLLVAPGDVAGLTAALGYLMDNPIERYQMGKAGRTRVLRDYEASNLCLFQSLF